VSGVEGVCDFPIEEKTVSKYLSIHTPKVTL